MSGYDLSGYIDVPSRIALFYKRYPEGSLQMDPIEWVEIEGKRWAIGRGMLTVHPMILALVSEQPGRSCQGQPHILAARRYRT